jgi:hypothetical protein
MELGSARLPRRTCEHVRPYRRDVAGRVLQRQYAVGNHLNGVLVRREHALRGESWGTASALAVNA